MELVDGKQKQLSNFDVITGAINNAGLAEDDGISMALGLIGGHMSNPSTTTIQINNTVFLYTATKKTKRAACYVYNLDVENQLPTNIYKFLRKVRRRGISSIMFICRDEVFLRSFLSLIPRLDDMGFKSGIGESKKKRGVYIAVVEFSESETK